MSRVTKCGPSGIPSADYFEVPGAASVYEWSPDPIPGRSPATQVHLFFGEPPGTVFVVRFKSPRTLSVLIHALREHRDGVWPNVCANCDGTGVLDFILPSDGTEAPQCEVCKGKGT